MAAVTHLASRTRPDFGEITSSQLPQGTVGQPYSTQLTTADGRRRPHLPPKRRRWCPPPAILPAHRSSATGTRLRNYLSARWPGDAYLFARRFLAMLQAPNDTTSTPAPTSHPAQAHDRHIETAICLWPAPERAIYYSELSLSRSAGSSGLGPGVAVGPAAVRMVTVSRIPRAAVASVGDRGRAVEAGRGGLGRGRGADQQARPRPPSDGLPGTPSAAVMLEAPP
jgi:hypothetical protein